MASLYSIRPMILELSRLHHLYGKNIFSPGAFWPLNRNRQGTITANVGVQFGNNPFKTFKLSCSHQLYNEINFCVSLWRMPLKVNKLRALAQGMCVTNLNYDLDKLIKLRHYQLQCVCQMQEKSVQEFWSYHGRTIFTGWSPHTCEESYRLKKFSV